MRKRDLFQNVISLLCIFSLSGTVSGCSRPNQPETALQSSLSARPVSAVSENTPSPADTLIEQIRMAEAETVIDPSVLNEEQIRACFYQEYLPDELTARIDGDMYDSNQSFISPAQLRLIHILYSDFQGQTRTGLMIVNELIGQDIEEIFYELYKMHYPVDRVALPFGYGENDEAVMTDDITRALAFTWTDGVPDEHEHSLGMAVDFNQLYNPQVITEDGQFTVLPAAALPYADRTQMKPHMMDINDPAVELFLKHGFTWGGIWETRNDYQHFEKFFNHETGHADPLMSS